MVTAVARKPMKNLTLIICRKDGEVSRKSKFVFYAKFWFQKIDAKAKKTVSNLLNSWPSDEVFDLPMRLQVWKWKRGPLPIRKAFLSTKKEQNVPGISNRNYWLNGKRPWAVRKILSSHPTVHCTQLRYPPSSVQSKIRIFLSELKSCYIFANTASGGL